MLRRRTSADGNQPKLNTPNTEHVQYSSTAITPSRRSIASECCCNVLILLSLWLVSLPIMNALAWKFAEPELGYDSVVDFLPTYGYQQSPNADSWELEVSAIVYKTDSNAYLKEKFLSFVQLLASYAGLEKRDRGILRSRMSIFTRDFQRNKYVDMHLCMSDPRESSERCPTRRVLLSQRIGPSSEDGLINAHFSLSKEQLNGVSGRVYVVVDRDMRDKLIVRAYANELSREGRRPVYSNSDRSSVVTLIPYEGFSIISDIDDTVTKAEIFRIFRFTTYFLFLQIKVTNVGNIPLVLKNTFAKDFVLIPEVYDMYKEWTKETDGRADIAFHYVSSSPWPLATLLFDWINEANLPFGTMHLKKFRFELFEPWGVDLSVFNLIRNPTKYKISKLQTILKNYPGRRFILVGDSSEKDPEVYGAVAREHQVQVVCSLIRNVSSRPIHRTRLDNAFFGIKSTNFEVIGADFKRPSFLAIENRGDCATRIVHSS